MWTHIKGSLAWSSKISLLTFVMAIVFSLFSFTFQGSGLIIGILIVLLFILIGIVGDTVGLAAATSKESDFHAMASRKIKGAKEAAYISRNAPIFSSIFNDVVGDIAGIISGAAASAVVLNIAILFYAGQGSVLFIVISVLFTSVIASLTVGGKAVCKTIAIYQSTNIILYTGKVMYYGKQVKAILTFEKFRKKRR